MKSKAISRLATSLTVGGKKIPNNPIKEDGVSAFLALVD